jgi:cation diffusion facilitator CzcD-associated flavoprotein CzcO
MANKLRQWLPAKLAYSIIRWRNVLFGMYFFRIARTKPEQVKQNIIGMVRQQLGPDYDVAKHFTPTYNPWDQRLCLVPDSDLFEAIKANTASVVTDHIESFTETGIKLKSGEELSADIVVSATGLKLEVLNGIQFTVDGRKVDASQTLGYKGMMYDGVPNLASSFGYTNASWTLKCDLTCEYVCRLLNHMDERGYTQCTPRIGASTFETQPFIDLKSGYVQRSIDKFPKQGLTSPWRLYQNYARDIVMLRYGSLEDQAMEFSTATGAPRSEEKIAA